MTRTQWAILAALAAAVVVVPCLVLVLLLPSSPPPNATALADTEPARLSTPSSLKLSPWDIYKATTLLTQAQRSDYLSGIANQQVHWIGRVGQVSVDNQVTLNTDDRMGYAAMVLDEVPAPVAHSFNLGQRIAFSASIASVDYLDNYQSTLPTMVVHLKFIALDPTPTLPPATLSP